MDTKSAVAKDVSGRTKTGCTYLATRVRPDRYVAPVGQSDAASDSNCGIATGNLICVSVAAESRKIVLSYLGDVPLPAIFIRTGKAA